MKVKKYSVGICKKRKFQTRLSNITNKISGSTGIEETLWGTIRGTVRADSGSYINILPPEHFAALMSVVLDFMVTKLNAPWKYGMVVTPNEKQNPFHVGCKGTDQNWASILHVTTIRRLCEIFNGAHRSSLCNCRYWADQFWNIWASTLENNFLWRAAV